MKHAAPLLATLALLAAPTAVASAQHAGGETLQIYDVRDLHVQPPLAEGATAEDAEARVAAIEADYARLAELTREHVQPELAEPTQQLLVAPGGSIVASLTAEQHESVRRFLAVQRDAARTLFDVQTRIVQMDPAETDRLGLTRQNGVLDDAQLAELLRAFERGAAEILTAPRVLVHPRARAEIVALEQTAYVKDFEVHEHVRPGDQTILDPIIDVVEDGIRLDTSVVPITADQVVVDLSVELSELVRPIPYFETEIEAGGERFPVSIGLPEIGRSRVDTRLLLADGATARIWTQGPWEKDVFVFVQVTRVEPIEREPEERTTRDA